MPKTSRKTPRKTPRKHPKGANSVAKQPRKVSRKQPRKTVEKKPSKISKYTYSKLGRKMSVCSRYVRKDFCDAQLDCYYDDENKLCRPRTKEARFYKGKVAHEDITIRQGPQLPTFYRMDPGSGYSKSEIHDLIIDALGQPEVEMNTRRARIYVYRVHGVRVSDKDVSDAIQNLLRKGPKFSMKNSRKVSRKSRKSSRKVTKKSRKVSRKVSRKSRKVSKRTRSSRKY